MSARGDGSTFDASADALYRRRRASAEGLASKRPVCGERILGWLRTTALHEAYRLLCQPRREPPSGQLADAPAFVPPRRDDPEAALEAGRALLALASLRERQRRYMAWRVGGFRYREIQELAGDATTYSPVIWSHPVSSPPATRCRALMTCR